MSLGASATVGATLASSAEVFRDLLSDENVGFFTAHLSRNQNGFCQVCWAGRENLQHADVGGNP